MPTDRLFKDQMGRAVLIPADTLKIVSIVPSQTELLFHLGLRDRIIGITRYCTHPADLVGSVTKIGGTKQLDVKLIISLKPDLIIANMEENTRSEIEQLSRHLPVWISNINNLADGLNMIDSIGEITGKTKEADIIKSNIVNAFKQLRPLQPGLRAAYLIWRKPYMLAGNDTFINDMLIRCGLQNAIENPRYPEASIENLINTNPNVVLLSSEPYPFKQKHIDELKLYLPNAKMYLVDGESFSWYGSRLQHSPAYFNQLIDKIERDIE